jgi:hypothetical protein
MLSPILNVLWVAALFVCATAFARSQAPAPAKTSHALRTLPLTKFYDTVPHQNLVHSENERVANGWWRDVSIRFWP